MTRVPRILMSLPRPREEPQEQMATVLAYWPAWRVTDWAQVEIGSRILIVGSGELAERVARLCRCRGALWTAVWGSGHPRIGVEYLIPLQSGQGARQVLSALPARPDSVAVLDCSIDVLSASLELCRDGGTVIIIGMPALEINLNLYPDAHRRELTVRVRSLSECGSADSEDWFHVTRRINTLFRLGLLAA